MPKLKVGTVQSGLLHLLRRAVVGGAVALLAGLTFASLPTSARAQTPATQTANESEASTKEDRLVLMQFSRCVVSRQRSEASALLAADYTTDAYRASVRRLTVPQHGCLPGGSGRLRFGGILFAGDLAETL